MTLGAASPHRDRADFRAGHGDQFGRGSSRPEQAKRDQDGEAHPSYATHFHPHLGKRGVAYFSPFECEVAHTSRGINGGSGGHQTRTASRRPSRAVSIVIEGVVIGVTGRQPYSESWQRFKPTHDPQQGLHVYVAIDNNAPTVRAHISIRLPPSPLPFSGCSDHCRHKSGNIAKPDNVQNLSHFQD